MLGSRRIGKSTLIKEFAKDYPLFIEIAGLAKRKNKVFRISDCYLRFYLKFIAHKNLFQLLQ
jgi:AAA+ ATPase superfamily predicted ATPase